jgi:DNA mismatch repair protein MutS2
MDARTLDKLEFGLIRQRLANLAATSLGQALCARIEPSGRREQIQLWFDQVRQMLAVETEHGLPPLVGIRDIRHALQHSDHPEAVTAEDLADIQQTLMMTTVLRRWLSRLPDTAPLLRRELERVHDLADLADEIAGAIDSKGRVLDEASPKLASIRSLIHKHLREITAAFDRILKQRRYQRMLQYASTTFHNDRMVLPLKSEHRGRIPGIVHRSSDSGATLFVEPSMVVELNNAIAKLRQRENEEISRILSHLARRVHAHAEEIQVTLRAASVLDLIRAKVNYARSRSAICPEINDQGVLDIHGARHPVLLEIFSDDPQRELDDVVPIDVRLGDDFDILVITGPNTGGKTVSLKTAGLIAVMTQSGIPVPVDIGSTMPIYERIFIDVGDEQSLEQSLSTFSAHLSNWLDMLRRTTARTLVLIDELGSGTDPDEGAAIGWAVMDELHDRGCPAIISTHLSQLKAVAYQMDRVDNASMEFDVASLQPTFQLRLGEPGNSQAIAIAQRLGMPKKMVARARRHLEGQHRALSEAIEGTLASRRQAEVARKAATQARLAAERQADELQRSTAALERERQAHQRWSRWLSTLAAGDWVFVATFGHCARVVRMQLHRQVAVVSRGAIDMEVQFSTLSEPSADQIAEAGG